ncbi:hypothetical protein VNO80_21878 [Phaseolus coccineus]|uniref:Uncharacterized protein n=1 Tax=Phaseolus coccineus TaxID=3886 RepID=A0AAN9M8X1_PHACN
MFCVPYGEGKMEMWESNPLPPHHYHCATQRPGELAGAERSVVWFCNIGIGKSFVGDYVRFGTEIGVKGTFLSLGGALLSFYGRLPILLLYLLFPCFLQNL